MSDKNTAKEDGEIELLSFGVAGQEYSVEITSVREIRGWTQATPLPHSPPYVRGVINLRGTVLPIVDLAGRLGESTGPRSDRDVVIVVYHNGHTVGLLVDAVSDILSISQTEMQPPPEVATDSLQGFIKSLIVVNGQMVRILDLGVVLPEEAVEAA
jgi:purine-binding chemotaxis protein CheW